MPDWRNAVHRFAQPVEIEKVQREAGWAEMERCFHLSFRSHQHVNCRSYRDRNRTNGEKGINGGAG